LLQKTSDGETANTSDAATYDTMINAAYKVLEAVLKQKCCRADVKRRRLELKANRSPRAHRSVVACIKPMLSMSIVMTKLSSRGKSSAAVGDNFTCGQSWYGPFNAVPLEKALVAAPF
jgi:hypothetical protein